MLAVFCPSLNTGITELSAATVNIGSLIELYSLTTYWTDICGFILFARLGNFYFLFIFTIFIRVKNDLWDLFQPWIPNLIQAPFQPLFPPVLYLSPTILHTSNFKHLVLRVNHITVLDPGAVFLVKVKWQMWFARNSQFWRRRFDLMTHFAVNPTFFGSWRGLDYDLVWIEIVVKFGFGIRPHLF